MVDVGLGKSNKIKSLNLGTRIILFIEKEKLL